MINEKANIFPLLLLLMLPLMQSFNASHCTMQLHKISLKKKFLWKYGSFALSLQRSVQSCSPAVCSLAQLQGIPSHLHSDPSKLALLSWVLLDYLEVLLHVVRRSQDNRHSLVDILRHYIQYCLMPGCCYSPSLLNNKSHRIAFVKQSQLEDKDQSGNGQPRQCWEFQNVNIFGVWFKTKKHSKHHVFHINFDSITKLCGFFFKKNPPPQWRLDLPNLSVLHSSCLPCALYTEIRLVFKTQPLTRQQAT